MVSQIQKIVSGGQTGVDRAALDAAIKLDLPCGGWCPKGRRAEDGPLQALYPLTETPSGDYIQRTEWNVRDSDATLILNTGSLEGGTAFTVVVAKRMKKPHWILQLPPAAGDSTKLKTWLEKHQVKILNVAGPRESKSPGVYAQAFDFLEGLFSGTLPLGQQTT